MKHMPECERDGEKTRQVLRLLIVGTQRSGEHDMHVYTLQYGIEDGLYCVSWLGTHYSWEMLNRLGVHVHHEGVGPDGAVGWLYAVKLVHQLYIM